MTDEILFGGKMAYNAKVDVELFMKEWRGEDGVSMIKVGVYSYNNGSPKVQIIRLKENDSGIPMFVKLGRLTQSELIGIIPLLGDAVDFLVKSEKTKKV